MNLFKDNFKMLSEVARLFYVYGCFSNTDFNDKVIKEKINNSLFNTEDTYNKWHQPVQFILEKMVGIPINQRNQTKFQHISNDRYSREVLGLVNLYHFCGKKQMKGCTIEYVNRIYNMNGVKSKFNKTKWYSEVEEYFGTDARKDSLFYMDAGKAKFSDEEFVQLFNALMFYNGKAPFSVPGYFACDKINDYMKLSDKKIISDIVAPVFEYNNIDRLLNDNAVYTIFGAMKNKGLIEFKTRKQEKQKIKEPIKALPLKVMYEFQSGRGWAIVWQDEIKCYRLDDMFEVEICKDKPSESTVEIANSELDDVLNKMWLSPSKNKAEYVVIDFDDCVANVNKIVPVGKVTKTARHKCRYEANLLNFKDIVPFVRRYGNKIHISKDDSPVLYAYVKKDIRKALEKYGAF